MKTTEPAYFCDFCGKHQNAVDHMISALHDVCICDECVDLCHKIVTDARNEKGEQQ